MQPSSSIMTVTASWALRGDPSLRLTFVQLGFRCQEVVIYNKINGVLTSSTVADLHLGKMPRILFPFLSSISQIHPFICVEPYSLSCDPIIHSPKVTQSKRHQGKRSTATLGRLARYERPVAKAICEGRCWGCC